jgi:hypothetical protein
VRSSLVTVPVRRRVRRELAKRRQHVLLHVAGGALSKTGMTSTVVSTDGVRPRVKGEMRPRAQRTSSTMHEEMAFHPVRSTG